MREQYENVRVSARAASPPRSAEGASRLCRQQLNHRVHSGVAPIWWTPCYAASSRAARIRRGCDNRDWNAAGGDCTRSRCRSIMAPMRTSACVAHVVRSSSSRSSVGEEALSDRVVPAIAACGSCWGSCHASRARAVLGRRVLGGFNRSSQHLPMMEVCDERCAEVGAEHSSAASFAGAPSRRSTRRSCAVLGSHCARIISGSCRRVGAGLMGGGSALVSASWWDAADSPVSVRTAALGAVLLLCRA